MKDNLSTDERKALINLRNNTEIVIKPEDKGPAFVIQNTSPYIHMLDLNNSNVYQKNDCDKTPETVDKVTRGLTKMLSDGDIDQKTVSYLVPGDVKPSQYYTLPQTHKDRDADGHLKTRPVISPIKRQFRVHRFLHLIWKL